MYKSEASWANQQAYSAELFPQLYLQIIVYILYLSQHALDGALGFLICMIATFQVTELSGFLSEEFAAQASLLLPPDHCLRTMPHPTCS